MRAVIVYESMFGNTRRIAESIADGLAWEDVEVIGVTHAGQEALGGTDLLVVGGPTHAWSMSRPSTRKGAPEYVRKSEGGLELEPGGTPARGCASGSIPSARSTLGPRCSTLTSRPRSE